MSILDFAKELGRKIIDRDDVAADNIKQSMNISLSPIKDLTVDFDDGVVKICGECMSEADRDYALLYAGNIQGVSRVDSSGLTAKAPAPEAPPEEKAEIYEIQSGDTLGAIAKKYYGKSGAYMRIFEANKAIIDDPNKIYPGPIIVQDFWITDSLLNFKLKYYGNCMIHFINLVKEPGELAAAGQPFELELRHNANEDAEDIPFTAFVSFKLNELELPEMDSVQFRVTSTDYDGELFEYNGVYNYGENN